MTRTRLPTNREGYTRKYVVGECTCYLTVNPRPEQGPPLEIFGKADEGFNGALEDICIPASMALQFGCPAAVLAGKLRHRHGYAPEGVVNQPTGLADAVGRALEAGGET